MSISSLAERHSTVWEIGCSQAEEMAWEHVSAKFRLVTSQFQSNGLVDDKSAILPTRRVISGWSGMDAAANAAGALGIETPDATRELAVKLLYTLGDSEKQLFVAKPRRRVQARVDAEAGVAQVPLAPCLEAILSTSPELAVTVDDFCVYTVDYGEPELPLLGHGRLAEVAPDAHAVGRMTRAPFGADSLEVSFRFVHIQPGPKSRPTSAPASHPPRARTPHLNTAETFPLPSSPPPPLPDVFRRKRPKISLSISDLEEVTAKRLAAVQAASLTSPNDASEKGTAELRVRKENSANREKLGNVVAEMADGQALRRSRRERIMAQMQANVSIGAAPQFCGNCGAIETSAWRPTTVTGFSHTMLLCNACGLYYRSKGEMRPKSLWERGRYRRRESNDPLTISRISDRPSSAGPSSETAVEGSSSDPQSDPQSELTSDSHSDPQLRLEPDSVAKLTTLISKSPANMPVLSTSDVPTSELPTEAFVGYSDGNSSPQVQSELCTDLMTESTIIPSTPNKENVPPSVRTPGSIDKLFWGEDGRVECTPIPNKLFGTPSGGSEWLRRFFDLDNHTHHQMLEACLESPTRRQRKIRKNEDVQPVVLELTDFNPKSSEADISNISSSPPRQAMSFEDISSDWIMMPTSPLVAKKRPL